MATPNVITIESNIPIPESRWLGNSHKYDFVNSLEVSDSFHINGNTPDYNPVSVRAYVYKLNKNTDRKYTIRTIQGPSKNPVEIRIWRTQ